MASFKLLRSGRTKRHSPGKDREEHVEETIDREYPHEKEVISQALGHMVRRVHRFPEPIREKADQCDGSYSNSIYRMRMLVCVVRVGPINKHSAPNHCGEHRKVDPVHPANSERVFLLQTDSGHSRFTESGLLARDRLRRATHSEAWGCPFARGATSVAAGSVGNSRGLSDVAAEASLAASGSF